MTFSISARDAVVCGLSLPDTPDDKYCSQGDNAPVLRARVTETLIDESPNQNYEMSGSKCGLERH